MQTNSAKAKIPPVELRWLDGVAPAAGTGVSWGVPFQQGAVQPDSEFELLDREGKPYPLQYRPLAYWPDGSLKWGGFSTVSDKTGRELFFLQPKQNKRSFNGPKIAIRESEEELFIYTGPIECAMPKSGTPLITSVKMGGKTVAANGGLLAVLQKGVPEAFGPQPDKLKLESRI